MRIVWLWVCLALVACHGAEQTTPQVDVSSPDTAQAVTPDSTGDTDEVDASRLTTDGVDASRSTTDTAPGCRVNEDCVASLGVPAAPEKPCGNCYAVCEKNTCGIVCYEAMECIFTAGCGPNCEPLCNTTADCFEEQGQVCVDGVCEEGSD